MKLLVVGVATIVACKGGAPAEPIKSAGSGGSAVMPNAPKRWYSAEQHETLRRQNGEAYAAFRASSCRTASFLTDSTELDGTNPLADIVNGRGELADCAARAAAGFDADCGQRVQHAIAAAIRTKTSCTWPMLTAAQQNQVPSNAFWYADPYSKFLDSISDVTSAMRSRFDAIVFGQELGRAGTILQRMIGVANIIKHGKAAMALAGRLPAAKLQAFADEAARLVEREEPPLNMLVAETLQEPTALPLKMALIGHEDSDSEPLVFEMNADLRAAVSKHCPANGTLKACFDALAAHSADSHMTDATLTSAAAPTQLVAAMNEGRLHDFAEYVQKLAHAHATLVGLRVALATRQLGHCPTAEELKASPFREYAAPPRLGDTLLIEAKGKTVQITTPAWISNSGVAFDCK